MCPIQGVEVLRGAGAECEEVGSAELRKIPDKPVSAFLRNASTSQSNENHNSALRTPHSAFHIPHYSCLMAAVSLSKNRQIEDRLTTIFFSADHVP